MIKGFEGYYQPDFDELWKEAIFVFDTNVLLDLFRYSANTRNELLEIIDKLDDRIWIPHQFFYEYHRNKMTIHDSLADAYRESEKQLENSRESALKQLNSLREELQNLKNRTGVEVDPRVEKVEAILAEIQSDISHAKDQHRRSLDDEPLEDKIVELFAENYGRPFDDSCLTNIRKQAKERLQRGIPPGSSKDNKKEKSDPDGDLIGWFQTIKHANDKKLPIILVTNDRDWFLNSSGKTVGPHPELLQEMYDKAGVSGYIYKTAQFVKYAREYLNAQVSEETIAEAESREAFRFQLESLRESSENVRKVLGQVSQMATNVRALQAGILSANDALRAAMLPGFDSETLLSPLPLFEDNSLRAAISPEALSGSPTKSTDDESDIPTTDYLEDDDDSDGADDKPAP